MADLKKIFLYTDLAQATYINGRSIQFPYSAKPME